RGLGLVCDGMEHGFLSQKGSGKGRSVKENDVTATNIGAVMDDAIPCVTVVDGNTQEENVPYVVDMTMEKDKLSSLEDTTVLRSFPPVPTQVTTSAGNAPGKSSYANVTGKPSGKKVNVRTLFTPGGNGIDVVVLVDSIRAIIERFANTAYGFFLGKKIQRISLTGFPAQSVGSSNTDVLDSPCLLVLITGTSQSRQHVITSLIHIESCKSPTKSLFDVGSSRISIFTVNT
ncbi:hypothetical protein Tco_1287119, partial [Tanacetum coccineum]